MYPFTADPPSSATISSSSQKGRASSVDNDHTRFARLVLPHLGDAYALARWITGNRAAAEDVVQDACIRAFRGIGGRPDGNACAWVLTLVHNTAHAWLRNSRRSATPIVEGLEAVEAERAIAGHSESETRETTLMTQVETTQLVAAIGDLRTPYRETLVLRDIQGLSYREIGEVTGVPIGTVMSRLARARGRLIAMMTKDEEHDGIDASRA
jgi:RNA polymerase sigma factor (sigma-70 family)